MVLIHNQSWNRKFKMLIAVRIKHEVLNVSVEENQTVLELKRTMIELKSMMESFPYWLTYHGLVLLDDTMISEIGYLNGTELLCVETLTTSVVIPTSKGNEVWKVALQPSKSSGSSSGEVLAPPSRNNSSENNILSKKEGFFSSIRFNGPMIDFNTIISCAGMMWSFWLLSDTISREVSSFKENKSFSDIAKSMVNGSIEGMLENISTIKKLLSTKLG